jgi:hypothetical protein
LSKPKEKSAEVIVVADTSRALTIDNTEVSPSSEGLNIKSVPNAAWSYIQPCIKRNRANSKSNYR